MIFIFGASIGSFLNVLIDRLPKDEPITGRSHCDFCKKKIAWYDLIPILSYFFLKGKSRCCDKKLSFQYPIVEILAGAAFVFVFFQGQNLLGSVLIMGILSCLMVVFFSDLKYHLISDYILVALFIFSFLYNVMVRLAHHDIFSAIIVGLPIFLIYYISHERAMGLGDVYLAAIIGFILGWKSGYIALYIAFVTGAVYGILLMILKDKKLKTRIAFGPFLVSGTVIMLFWGERISDIIKGIYGF
ncbi:MAG: Type 4 prepilin-like protein leader peptide-processing enzyme [Candidatus Roizmanbacteria bacterium GW2011_GWA2_35_8]|uniref:Type 4 prepilin-like protein leader peptide-processing enzyme n=1 Tax=Candidatus Roizmanbacteria bacterium GW2011_GWA2_35_8 TaxID=1618479 RepID=A0A0G0G346_9BACT|nr:MAG: Type 4 prepilin-like protein leader peptide-processing enzyme [Candidatus Roizmanbacteria bacterium GW2011_GWA2_35_8]